MAGLGLYIGIGAIVGVILLFAVIYVLARRKGVQSGTTRIVRCREGHLFTTTFVPGVSFKAVRLGSSRYQHCPVGNHWSVVSTVDPRTLTPEQRAAAEAVLDTKVP